MIVGRGLIASQFTAEDREDVVFFASGVSNSSETDINQFQREKELVEKVIAENPEKLFIYFSTCSIYDSSKYNSLYVLHKLHMEEIIKENSFQYIILRISNAVGYGGNPNLLMNYFYRQIKEENPFTIHSNATRNLIDVEDVKNIALKYINENKYNRIVNVAYKENFLIPEIVGIYENVLGIRAKIFTEDKGENYSIDIHELDYNFNEDSKTDYLTKMIRKYYTK